MPDLFDKTADLNFELLIGFSPDTSASSRSRTYRVTGRPFAAALALTATSNDAGRRMFKAADFDSILQRTGLKPERSNSERSAVSTKSSAASSVDSLSRASAVYSIVPAMFDARSPPFSEVILRPKGE